MNRQRELHPPVEDEDAAAREVGWANNSEHGADVVQADLQNSASVYYWKGKNLKKRMKKKLQLVPRDTRRGNSVQTQTGTSKLNLSWDRMVVVLPYSIPVTRIYR